MYTTYIIVQVHDKGLQYGIYATYGKRTCMGFAGTQVENMQTDARQFAEWKVDYLKLDGCFNQVDTLEPGTHSQFTFLTIWPRLLLPLIHKHLPVPFTSLYLRV